MNPLMANRFPEFTKLRELATRASRVMNKPEDVLTESFAQDFFKKFYAGEFNVDGLGVNLREAAANYISQLEASVVGQEGRA